MVANKYLFEEMPARRALLTLSIPTIISQLITMIYNLADTFFIGRTQNPYMVAAATLSFVLVFSMNAFANLFGVGGGSHISRLLGINKTEDAKKVCALSFYGAISVALLYSAANLAFMEPILRALGASGNTMAYCKQYVFFTVVLGALPTVLAMTMANLLRSEGYAKYASIGLGAGGVLNIILDPVFMFVILEPGYEVMGAAIATLISNTISCAFFFYMFHRVKRKGSVLNLKISNVELKGEYIKPVLAVGLPSALGSLLASASNMVINKLSSGYDDIAVAAIGVVKKIDMLPMNIGMGLCQGMMPLVAYNYSAKNYKRMKSFTHFARTWGILFAAVCILLFEIFSKELVTFFIDDAATIALGKDYLRIACLATPFMITNVQMSFALQAMGKGKQSLILSSCRQGLVNIPLLFLMNYLFDLYGIVSTQLLADGITMFISFAIYGAVYKKIEAEIRAEEAKTAEGNESALLSKE